MSAAKHTPGPWTWEEGQGDIKREWNRNAWAVARVAGCRLGWHENPICEAREAGANARLIAAAPELLEALQQVRSWMIPGMNWSDDIGQMLKDMADAAIKKALGDV